MQKAAFANILTSKVKYSINIMAVFQNLASCLPVCWECSKRASSQINVTQQRGQGVKV